MGKASHVMSTSNNTIVILTSCSTRMVYVIVSLIRFARTICMSVIRCSTTAAVILCSGERIPIPFSGSRSIPISRRIPDTSSSGIGPTLLGRVLGQPTHQGWVELNLTGSPLPSIFLSACLILIDIYLFIYDRINATIPPRGCTPGGLTVFPLGSCRGYPSSILNWS